MNQREHFPIMLLHPPEETGSIIAATKERGSQALGADLSSQLLYMLRQEGHRLRPAWVTELAHGQPREVSKNPVSK